MLAYDKYVLFGSTPRCAISGRREIPPYQRIIRGKNMQRATAWADNGTKWHNETTRIAIRCRGYRLDAREAVRLPSFAPTHIAELRPQGGKVDGSNSSGLHQWTSARAKVPPAYMQTHREHDFRSGTPASNKQATKHHRPQMLVATHRTQISHDHAPHAKHNGHNRMRRAQPGPSKQICFQGANYAPKGAVTEMSR